MSVQPHVDSASRARQFIQLCTRHRQSHPRTPTLSCITRQRRRLSALAALARMNLLKTSPKSKTSTSDMAVFQFQKGFFVPLVYTNIVVEGSRPGGRPKRTWREVVQKDCQVRNLNREDAVDRDRWKKPIMIG